MLKSMTGFGAASVSEGTTQVRVEMKSVNHRFFDLSLSIPRPLTYMEDKLKKVIRTRVARGAFSVFISVSGSKLMTPVLETNWRLVDQYIEACRAIEKRCAGDPLDMSRILDLPGVFTIREPESDASSQLEPLILKAASLALDRLIQMRSAEGEALGTDFHRKIAGIRSLIRDLEAYEPEVRASYEKRLRKNVADFLAGRAALDEQRLLNEIAVFADKSAIDEELTRMHSHLEQFLVLLDEPGPAGRRLDFLIQEMNREMNTIGSKGSSAAMSHLVVSIKNEIEKLREQVQNIE